MEKKIYEVNINNYCLSYYGRIMEIGNTYFLELALYFPSYDSLGKDVLEDNLKFKGARLCSFDITFLVFHITYNYKLTR